MDNTKDNKSMAIESIKIAIPSIIDNVLSVLVGLVDTMMVSRIGTAAISSIGVTNQPKLFIFSIFFSMQICISILAARKLGENDKEDANRLFLAGFIIVVSFSIILSIVFSIFAYPFMKFCGANSEIIDNATSYFRIIMLGSIFNALFIYINAALRGCGNTKITLRTNLVSYIFNIIFNYLLIYGNFGFPRLEVKGAAIATVIGTFAASVMAIISVIKEKNFISVLYIIKNKIKVSIESFKLIIKVWWSILTDSLLSRVGFMINSIIVARIGTMPYAVHTVGMQMLSFAYSFGEGLSTSSVALVGRSLGESNIELAKKYANINEKIGIIISIFISTILVLFGKSFFDIFFDTSEELKLGYRVSLFLAVVIPIATMKLLMNGIVRAGGDVKYVMKVSIISNTIMQPVVAFLLIIILKLGIYGAWIGIFLAQFTSFILVLKRYKSDDWIKLKL